MAHYNDSHRNAVVGTLVDVAQRSWGGSDHRMVVIETDDPFVRVIVRTFVNNHKDAELLIDRKVCVHDATIIPFPGKPETVGGTK
jgi:hypothetical protein